MLTGEFDVAGIRARCSGLVGGFDLIELLLMEPTTFDSAPRAVC